MNTEAINFSDKFKKLNEFWSPRVIAEMNDYQFKIAKFKNEFVCLICIFQSILYC